MIKHALLFPVILFLSCAGSTQDKRALYYHLTYEPDNLNPIISNDYVQSRINEFIMEPLIDRDKDTLAFIPRLADRWSVSPSGLVFTFHLKKDITWSDGEPFTSSDILFSFKKIMDPLVACAPQRVYYSDIASVNIPDPFTVQFVFKKKYFKALEICASIPVVPEHICKNDKDFNSSSINRFPMGTGPFRFVSWDSGRSIVLERNERYKGKKPAIEKIVFKVIPEPNVALQLLKKGELDYMALRPIQWARQTNSEKFNAHFYKLQRFFPNYSYIAWNSKRKFFSSPKVRRALTMLINRSEMSRKLFFGIPVETTGPFYIKGDDFDKTIQPYPYDPIEARRIFEQEGWKDSDNDGILDSDGTKFSFTFSYPAQSKNSERISTILKEDFRKAGIEVNIQRYDWGAFLKKVEDRDYDSFIMSWASSYESDLYQVWHSSQRASGSNYVNYANPRVDRLIETAQRELDYQKRKILYRQIHRILYDDQPYTFLFCTPELLAVSKRFSNVIMHTGDVDILEWTFADE